MSSKMLLNGQLEDPNNVGLEQINRSEDELMKIFDINTAELKAMVIHTFQSVFEPVMETLIRRVVKDEMELQIEKVLTSMNLNREIETSTLESRNLKLEFRNKISNPIFTGKDIKGEGTIPIALIDNFTGQVVKTGPEASAQVEVVVIAGDFGRDDWTLEEFNENIVKEHGGKKSILTGNVYLKMNEGIGFVGDIRFIHDSNWMKNSEFRLGARVVDTFDGTRVKEGKTDSFLVKDYRNEYRKKCDIPSLTDEVWRLKKIGKSGTQHLKEEKIYTVKDFLILHYTNPERLQQILGEGTKMKITVDHALTCWIDETVYLYYYAIFQQKAGVVFNVVGQVLGLLLEYQYVLTDELSESQKGVACKSVVSAFANWDKVTRFDNENSLRQYCSDSFNACKPSDFIESPSSQNLEASEMINEYNNYTQPSTFIQDVDLFADFPEMIREYNYTQPSTSIQNVDLFADLPEERCSLNGYEVISIDTNIAFTFDQPVNVPGQGSNSEAPNFNREYIVPDSEEIGHQGFPTDNCVHEQITATDYLLSGVQAVSIKKARKSWIMLYSVLRWISIWRRIPTSQGIRVQKKSRFC